MQSSKNTEKLKKFIYDKFLSNELDNTSLVQIIILCFDLLGLKTINAFAKLYGKTYIGVKNFNKNIVDINCNEFVIDND